MDPPPRFRILDLGTLGLDTRAWGINEHGEIVGQSAVGGQGQIRPFVWLPAPLFEGLAGELCPGIHDLSVLGSCGGQVAYDINQSREIAGGEIETEAIVWKLTSLGVVCTDAIPFLSGGSWNIANALNDQDAPLVVGQSEFDDPDCDLLGRGYRVRVDLDVFPAQITGLQQLPPAPLDNGSDARDVNNTVQPSGLPQIAGASAFTNTAICSNGSPCLTTHDSVTWEPVATLPRPGTNGAEARGNNDDDHIVGWWLNDALPCRKRAMFWDPTQVPTVTVELGAIAPLEPLEETQAEAVSDQSEIVGWNITSGDALLWDPIPGNTWRVVNLDDAVCDCDDDWIIREAHDVNDDGWIVGWGVTNPGPRAFLLRPINQCPEDLNGDGDIDETQADGNGDLQILENNWTGSSFCGSGSPEDCNDRCCICRGDLDGDCKINTADLLIMLAKVGSFCPGFGACEGSEDWGQPMEQALAVMDFESLEAYELWLTVAGDDEAYASLNVLLTLLDV